MKEFRFRRQRGRILEEMFVEQESGKARYKYWVQNPNDINKLMPMPNLQNHVRNEDGKILEGIH